MVAAASEKKEKSRNIYLPAALEEGLERESRHYGVKRRVMAAALWLFLNSDQDVKDAAIEAAVDIEEGRGLETPDERVARLRAELDKLMEAIKPHKKSKR